MPEQIGEDWQGPQALTIEAQCWDAVRAYSSRLRLLCDPHRDTPLDDRLKGVYGRLHVQAVKLPLIFAALDWLESDRPAPVVTPANWQTARTLTEHWRLSAHLLLEQLDHNGAGRDERRQQGRVYAAIGAAGRQGTALRDVYRRLNLKAQEARMLAQELIKAGLIVPVQLGSAEGYATVAHLSGPN